MTLILLILIGALVGVFRTKSRYEGEQKPEEMSVEAKIELIFKGEMEMDIEVSKELGKRANKVTNEARLLFGLKELVWSDNMHRIAYNRCYEVA